MSASRPRAFSHRFCGGLTLAAILMLVVPSCSPTAGLPPSFVPETPVVRSSPGGFALSPLPLDRPDSPLTEAAAGLLFIADFGGGEAQQSVAEAMLGWKRSGHRVDAVVTAGDNVYPRGQESSFDAQLRRPYSPLEVPMIAAVGNHDFQTKKGRPILRYLGQPDPPSAHRFGPVEVLVLDSNEVNEGQALWLDRSLAESQAAVRIVVFHHPAFSCGPHGSTKSVQQRWLPILSKHRVELVVSGHDHNYQKILLPLDTRSAEAGPTPDTVDGRDHTTFIVTGGGGRELAGAKGDCKLGPARPLRFEPRHEFVSVEASESGLWVLRAVTIGGAVIDTWWGTSNRSESPRFQRS